MTATTLVDEILRNYAKNDGATDLEEYAERVLRYFLAYAVENDVITINEPKHTHTFGGVSATLTDTQFATVLAYTRSNRTINAIKELRNATGNGLKDSKDFVDHLGKVLALADGVPLTYNY